MTLSLILYFSILGFAVITGIAKYSGLTTPARILFLLVAFVLIKELSASLLAEIKHYNLSFYQFLSPVDFCLTAWLFVTIPLMKNFRKLIYFLTGTVAIFYFLNLFIWQPPGSGADTNFKILRSLFLVFLGLVLFMRLSQNPDEESIFAKSSFWLSIGIIIFYSFNIFYWGAYNYFLDHNQGILNAILRPLFVGVNYILYSFLGVALYLNRFYNKKTLLI